MAYKFESVKVEDGAWLDDLAAAESEDRKAFLDRRAKELDYASSKRKSDPVGAMQAQAKAAAIEAEYQAFQAAYLAYQRQFEADLLWAWPEREAKMDAEIEKIDREIFAEFRKVYDLVKDRTAIQSDLVSKSKTMSLAAYHVTGLPGVQRGFSFPFGGRLAPSNSPGDMIQQATAALAKRLAYFAAGRFPETYEEFVSKKG